MTKCKVKINKEIRITQKQSFSDCPETVYLFSISLGLLLGFIFAFAHMMSMETGVDLCTGSCPLCGVWIW